jgi:hypothetical protein
MMDSIMVDVPTPRNEPPRPAGARTAIWDDYGVRFEYPAEWDVDVNEDGTRTTVSVQSPDGMAFAFVAVDDDAPAPSELADEALEAMKAEYTDLEITPVRETIDGHPAIGHDLEFFSLDVPGGCAIRAFRTPRRTVLVFEQWSDLDPEDSEGQMRLLRRTLEETEG